MEIHGQNNIFFGIGKPIKKRYEHHKGRSEAFIRTYIVPEMSGNTRELQNTLTPKIEKAAKFAAVSKTAAEITGLVAAIGGTVYLGQKLVRAKGMGIPSGEVIRQPFKKLVPMSERPVDISHLVDVQQAVRIGSLEYMYDMHMRRFHPGGSLKDRAPHVFRSYVRRFIDAPIPKGIIAELESIQKIPGDDAWKGKFYGVLKKHFDGLFEQDTQNYGNMGAYRKLRKNILEVMVYAESQNRTQSLTGFLDARHLNQALEYVSKPAAKASTAWAQHAARIHAK